MLSVTFIQMLDLIELLIIHQFLYFQIVTGVFSVHRHYDEWAIVASCTGITKTYCNLRSLIHDYHAKYKVKVQLVAGDNESAWTRKTFQPNESKHIVVSLV